MRARPEAIEIERSGVDGGQTRRAQIDPARMTPEVARAIAVVTDEIRPSHGATPPGGPDRLSYDIVLRYEGTSERLSYGEEELPDYVRATLDALVVSPEGG